MTIFEEAVRFAVKAHSGDPSRQARYYRSIEELTDELKNTIVWKEYQQFVSTIFEGIE